MPPHRARGAEDGPGSARPGYAARALDELVLYGRLRPLFKAPGYELRYAEPVGAFLGELIRRHTGAEWVDDVLSPKLVIHRPGGTRRFIPLRWPCATTPTAVPASCTPS